MELGFLFSLIIPLIFSLFLFFKLIFKDRKLPPGPWKLPLIGSMHHLAGSSLPHHALRDLARKHGHLMHLQLGEISAMVISSARVAEEVLKTNDLCFVNRPELLAIRVIKYYKKGIGFAPYGEYWRQMRKLCTLELLSAKNVRSFSSIRENEVWHLIESIQSSAGSLINLSEKMSSLTNNIACRTAFGIRCKDQDAFVQLIQELSVIMGGFDVADLFPSFKVLHFLSGMKPKLVKVHKKIDQILDGIVGEHEENLASTRRGSGEEGEDDLLDMLLKLKHSSGLGFPFASDNIKAVIFDMIAGGTETSSTLLDWTMSEMMRNPKVMEKAQAEVRQALKGKTKISETDIQGLSYLKLVIKETLRLHTPLPLLLPRECTQQCEIDGYKIPVKTKVIVNSWAIGRDPSYWHDAESFKPERFENNSLEFKGTNFEYIPFGAGRRMCPGISFGLTSVELPLAQLLYHFDWSLPSGMKPAELDMSEVFGATAERKYKLYLTARSHTSFSHSC